MNKKLLLYWFNKYWVFPDPSHAHWEPSTQAYREIVALIQDSASKDEDWDNARDAYGTPPKSRIRSKPKASNT